jgi:hypothetical protein
MILETRYFKPKNKLIQSCALSLTIYMSQRPPALPPRKPIRTLAVNEERRRTSLNLNEIIDFEIRLDVQEMISQIPPSPLPKSPRWKMAAASVEYSPKQISEEANLNTQEPVQTLSSGMQEIPSRYSDIIEQNKWPAIISSKIEISYDQKRRILSKYPSLCKLNQTLMEISEPQEEASENTDRPGVQVRLAAAPELEQKEMTQETSQYSSKNTAPIFDKSKKKIVPDLSSFSSSQSSSTSPPPIKETQGSSSFSQISSSSSVIPPQLSTSLHFAGTPFPNIGAPQVLSNVPSAATPIPIYANGALLGYTIPPPMRPMLMLMRSPP